MEKIPCSVLVLTLNEEMNLARCLESLRWSDDVVVFDSFSTDRTVEIAKQYGARIVQRQFDNWSSHQNWAVSNIPFKYPWVYYSDADEVVTEELAATIDRIARDPSHEEVAYGVLRKEMLWGRWLRRSSMYPVWILRLFRPDKIRWERLVNPVAVIDGPSGKIADHIIHYSFSKGLTEWINKHTEYARFEAREALRTVRGGMEDFWGAFSIKDPVRRRKSIKALSYHLPFRPFLRFFYMYILRMGCLDGLPGLTYCRLVAMYEYMIDLNVKEFKRRERHEQI